MIAHSLGIHRFQTRLALTGQSEDGPPLGQEVGRAVRELLPAAAGRALEPLLGGRDGVLRIDRIALKLRLARGELSARGLADLLARQIARAVAERSAGSAAAPRVGAGLGFWPDHASYAASYVALRLRLAPAPEWAFPDFQALAHLAAHEAALELLAARPAILAALARLLGAAGAQALAASLPERTATLLIERLQAGLPAALPLDATELAAMIAALPAGSESSPSRAAIAAIASSLSPRAAIDDDSIRQLATLARLAVALAALRDATFAAWDRAPVASDLVPEALLHLPEPARHLAQMALARLTDAEPIRAALARLLDPAHRRAAIVDQASTQHATAAARHRAITSRIAGIGLLMPAALAHGLPELLSAAALNRMLVAAAGPEAEGAALDPVLAALAPFDPRGPEPAFPPVPEAMRAAVPEARRAGEAAGEGAVGWAACLIHAFAAGLAGFETSSLRYLRRQFLTRPGTLHISEDGAEGRLALVLDPLPLGILLRLSGIHGWSGRLPQAQGALLRIEIREG